MFYKCKMRILRATRHLQKEAAQRGWMSLAPDKRNEVFLYVQFFYETSEKNFNWKVFGRAILGFRHQHFPFRGSKSWSLYHVRETSISDERQHACKNGAGLPLKSTLKVPDFPTEINEYVTEPGLWYEQFLTTGQLTTANRFSCCRRGSFNADALPHPGGR